MQTLGERIAALRKAQGMTQLELAEKMGITDKAVSKWERNLACPDVHSFPKLALILGVTVAELMQQEQEKSAGCKVGAEDLKQLVFRAVALAMGVALVVLSLLERLDVKEGLGLAGVGITALSLHCFFEKRE